MRPYTSTIFAEMSALAVAHRCDQPRPGVPRHRRAAAMVGGRDRGDPGGRQPVPTRHRDRPAACGGGRAPAPVLRARRTTPTPRCSSPPAPPRRSRDRARAVRAGRRGGDLRAVLRLVRRVIALAGAVRRTSSSAPARLRVRPRPAARGDHAEDEVGAAQLAAQPDRQGVLPRRAAIGELGRRARCSWSPTRCTSTSCTTGEHIRSRRCRGCASARSRSRRRARRSPMTGWKTGWALRPPPAHRGRAHGEAALTYVTARRSSTRSPRAAPPRRVLRRLAADLRPSATCCAAGSPTAGFTVYPRRARTSSPPTRRRSA